MVSKKLRLLGVNNVPVPSALHLCIGLLSIALMGCGSWVPLTSGGKQVDLRIATSVQSCTKVGSLTVNGVEKIGFVPRGKNKVQTELSNQARNDAAVMGANVVVPEGGVKQGRRSFIAYRCP